MHLTEAFEKLNELTEDVNYSAKYYDETTGKSYKIENGEFIEIIDEPKKGGGSKEQQQKQDTKDSISASDFETDPGNKYQQIEDLLRAIEDMKDRINRLDNPNAAESTSDINDISDQIVAQAEDLDEEIKKLQKQLEDLKKQFKSKGGTTQEEIDNTEERIKAIEDVLHSTEVADKIMKETQEKVFNSRQQKIQGEKEAKRKQKMAEMSDKDVINLIKASLAHTLKQEIIEHREETWSRFNKKAYAAGLLNRGVRINEERNLPSLSVYFDRSSSWGPDKSEFGENAVNSISYLAKKGELNLKIFYFNSRGVTSTDPGMGSGSTPAEPVVTHIRDTKPDNVFIMTDSDFDVQGGYNQPNTTVPGAVWMLFKGSISKSLQERLHGKKFTKSFFIK